MNKIDRILWLDASKGIGMLLIMLVHMNFFIFSTQYLTAGYVSMFYVASGITFKFKSDILANLKKKAFRLLIPYTFYTIGIVFLTVTMSILAGKDIDIIQKIYGVLYSRYCLYPELNNPTNKLLLNGGNAPLWFMTSLFTSFLFVFIWQWLKRKNIILISYFILAILGSQMAILLPWGLDMAPLCALLTITGFKYRKLFDSPKYKVLFIPVLIIYIGIVYINGTSNMSLRQYGDLGATSVILFFILSILAFWLISTTCQILEKTTFIRVMAYIGRNSLRLMCIHMFIWISFKDIFLSKLGEEWHFPLIIIALIVIFGVNHTFNIICNKWNQQIPLLKYI